MIPRKKDPRRTPDEIAPVPPVEEECEGCALNEGECCPESSLAQDDKKSGMS